MSNELLPLPNYIYGRECSENERVYTEQQMREYARANLQAAKPAGNACLYDPDEVAFPKGFMPAAATQNATQQNSESIVAQGNAKNNATLPATDALGSLGVVAQVRGHPHWHIHMTSHGLPVGTKLTDHAQATAEIAKYKERFRVAMVDVEVSREKIRLRDMDLAGLLDALRSIKGMTDADDEESYRSDDREGCLDTVFSTASEALATYEAAQGEKT